jgi:hypothetical protein
MLLGSLVIVDQCCAAQAVRLTRTGSKTTNKPLASWR